MQNPIEPNKKTDPVKATKYVFWLVENKFKGSVLKGHYHGATSQFLVQCENKNHPQFKTSWFYLKRNQWCKECKLDKNVRGKYRITIEDCKKLANKRGWHLISKRYEGPKKKLKWLCPVGHEREMTYHNLSWNKGCGECSENDPVVAHRNFIKNSKLMNLKILKEYKNAYSRVKVKCLNCGNIWEPVGRSIATGKHGCQKCSTKKNSQKRKKNIVILKAECKKIGYKLHSTEYTDINTKILVECIACGDKKWKTPNSIQQGKGCIRCYHKKQKIIPLARQREVIEELAAICKRRQWTLITKTNDYAGTLKPVHIRCLCGHEWHPVRAQIIDQNGGCPNCSSGLGERLVRIALEWLTDKPFKKTNQLTFLRNPKSGRILELDGYNDELNLAFEHQGGQHYKKSHYFHKDRNTFKEQLERDKIKKKLCKKNGINIIFIRETLEKFDLDQLQQFLIKKLKLLNIPIRKIKAGEKPDWDKAYIPKMKILTEEAKSFSTENWKILSTKVLSVKQKVKFKCSIHNLDFEQSLTKLRTGRGCSRCGRERAWTSRRKILK